MPQFDTSLTRQTLSHFLLSLVGLWFHFNWNFEPFANLFSTLCSALTSLSLVYQARAGLVPSTDVLKVVEAFNSESNYTVWNDLSINLSGFGTLLQTTDFYQNFQGFCVKLYEPVASKLGWEAKEGESESWLFHCYSMFSVQIKFKKCKKLNSL